MNVAQTSVQNEPANSDASTNAQALAAETKVGQGRFTLKKILGQGGMGMVWLAQDERLDELVALKFLPPQIRFDAVGLAGLRRETQRSRKLTHPNIIRIHDLHETEGEDAAIAMEYVDGMTLSALRLLQRNEIFTWPMLAPLVKQLCDALDYAHGEKVIHRDLKPANLMIDRNGRLKLADFGIASVISDSMSRMSNQPASGTLAYMSPQQINGERPQVTDDIYSLGATLYELLTGTPPFHSGQILHQVLNNHPTSVQERLAEVELQNEIPADVESMIMACLAKDPAQRPQSARAIADWIGFETSLHPQSLEATLTVPEEEIQAQVEAVPLRKRFWIVAALALLTVTAAGVLLWSPWKRAAPAVAALYPQPRVWIDATEKIRRDGLNTGTLKADGDWLAMADEKERRIILGGGSSFGNVALRILFSNQIDVQLRKSSGKAYRGHMATSASIKLIGGKPSIVTLHKGNLDLGENAAHELVFAVQGDNLSLWLDGKEIAQATDQTLRAGTMEIIFIPSKEHPSRIKKVEYGELDAAGTGIVPAQPPVKTETVVFADNFENSKADGASWDWGNAGRAEKSFVAENGNHFVRLEGNDVQTNRRVQMTLPVRPEWKKLTCSVRIRTRDIKINPDKKWSGVKMDTYVLDGKKSTIRSTGAGNTGILTHNTDWQTMTNLLEVLDGARYLRLDLTLYQTTGVADFDDVKVTVVEEKLLPIGQLPTAPANDTNVGRIVLTENFETLDDEGRPKGRNPWRKAAAGEKRTIRTESRNNFLEYQASATTNLMHPVSVHVKLKPEWKMLKVSVRIRTQNLSIGTRSGVTLLTGFADILDDAVGSWKTITEYRTTYVKTNSNWQLVEKIISVPPDAKYFVVSPTLAYASGVAHFDDITVTVVELNSLSR